VTIDIRMKDGGGRNRAAVVTVDRELCVIQVPHPPIVSQKTKPFRQFLTADGLASGSNDMGIDGSTVNADFFIDASQTADRYLTRLNFIIGYGLTGQPNEWADGVEMYVVYDESPSSRRVLHLECNLASSRSSIVRH